MKHKTATLYLFFTLFLSSSFCSAQDTGKDANKSDAAEEALSESEEVCRTGEKVEDFPFYVYEDAGSLNNHFAATGHMGDYTDLDIDLFYKQEPYSGPSCIKISYSSKKSRGYKWAGLYWQDPSNNWGESFGGFDLSKATKLTFWAKGENGGEVIKIFQIGGIVGKYRDSGSKSISPVILTKQWKQYTIDLKDMKEAAMLTCKQVGCCLFMQPLSRIIGGFCFSTNIEVNHGGITFYLDEIKYEKD